MIICWCWFFVSNSCAISSLVSYFLFLTSYFWFRASYFEFPASSFSLTSYFLCPISINSLFLISYFSLQLFLVSCLVFLASFDSYFLFLVSSFFFLNVSFFFYLNKTSDATSSSICDSDEEDSVESEDSLGKACWPSQAKQNVALWVRVLRPRLATLLFW